MRKTDLKSMNPRLGGEKATNLLIIFHAVQKSSKINNKLANNLITQFHPVARESYKTDIHNLRHKVTDDDLFFFVAHCIICDRET
jgi:hypothetical protein